MCLFTITTVTGRPCESHPCSSTFFCSSSARTSSCHTHRAALVATPAAKPSDQPYKHAVLWNRAAHLQDAAPRQVVTAPLKVVPQAFESLVYVVLLRPQPALQLSERNLLWQESLPQVLLGSPAKCSALCIIAEEEEQHWQGVKPAQHKHWLRVALLSKRRPVGKHCVLN